jgi:hypothetical protein
VKCLGNDLDNGGDRLDLRSMVWHVCCWENAPYSGDVKEYGGGD